jgi:AcrR family transcriptional regulator
LFAHYGYGKTTVDDSAALAGISKGAVYLSFSRKNALLELFEIIGEFPKQMRVGKPDSPQE